MFGFDKEIISILPYSYIEKPFFQFYLKFTPTDPIITDLLALLLSLILALTSLVFIIIKKDNRIRFLLFFLSFLTIAILSLYITLTRNNYYSVQIENCYKEEIKYINVDGKRKIKQLKPNEKRWIIYKSSYPNKKDNSGETWRHIDYVINESRLQIYVFTRDSMEIIRIPEDNNDPGGIKKYKE